MAARVPLEPEHRNSFRDALSASYAAGETALARNAMGRRENTRAATAASLPAFWEMRAGGPARRFARLRSALRNLRGTRHEHVHPGECYGGAAARWLLGRAGRHWPAEIVWGLAGRGIDETASARAALRWSLGGLDCLCTLDFIGGVDAVELSSGGSSSLRAREGPDGPSCFPAFASAYRGDCGRGRR